MAPYVWTLFLLFIRRVTHWILSLPKPAMQEKLIDLAIHITLKRSWLLDKDLLPDYCLPLMKMPLLLSCNTMEHFLLSVPSLKQKEMKTVALKSKIVYILSHA